MQEPLLFRSHFKTNYVQWRKSFEVKKLKLGVDIDGTIKDTHRAAVEVYNEEFQKTVCVDEVPEFHMDRAFGLTPEEGRKTWRKLEEKIYTLGIPLPNASEVLNQLQRDGHEIYYITARPGKKNIKEVTKNWLKKHGFPYHGDHLLMNSVNKAKVAKKIGIDLFFEDAPNHLDCLYKAGVPTVIVDAVYNRDYPHPLPRITDWKEVYEMVT